MALKEKEFKVTREQNTQQRLINTSEDPIPNVKNICLGWRIRTEESRDEEEKKILVYKPKKEEVIVK
jgi:hypothetical protein